MRHASDPRLVPPTLHVIATLIAKRKHLHYAVARMQDRLRFGHSFARIDWSGMPGIRIASLELGDWLICTLTETRDSSLVWVESSPCHPVCSYIGRTCEFDGRVKNYLENLKKIHEFWFARLPTC